MVNPSRSWLVGWGYAYHAYFTTFKHPKRKLLWKALVKKKWFWYSTEDRLRSHDECVQALETVKVDHTVGYDHDYYDYYGDTEGDDTD